MVFPEYRNLISAIQQLSLPNLLKEITIKTQGRLSLLFLTKFAGWFGEQCPKPLKQILKTSMSLLIRRKWD